MSATCPVCATPVAADAAYCHECGASLPGAVAAVRQPAPPAAPQPTGANGLARPAATGTGIAADPHPKQPASSAAGFAPVYESGPLHAALLAEPVRQRPAWMAASLVMVTFGVYWLVWFGQTWGEMKRLVRDPGMSPLGHALTPLVPVYGLFRTHAHFRVMAVLLQSGGVPLTVPPRLAVVLALVSGVFGFVALRPGVTAAEFVVLMLGSLAALARLAARGQTALNGLWRAEFGADSPTGARWGEWLALVLCGLVFVLFVLGGLVG